MKQEHYNTENKKNFSALLLSSLYLLGISAFFPATNATKTLCINVILTGLVAAYFWRKCGFPIIGCYPKFSLEQKLRGAPV